jgi:uncharacterized Tic20 family protein
MSEKELVEGLDEKKKGETKKLEPGVEIPKPKPRRAETKKLSADPGMDNETLPVVVPHLGLTQEELTWAALAHASILVTLLLGLLTGGIGAILGVFVPALIWYVYREKSDYVTNHARQATVFQLAGFVALLALVFLGTILVVVGWTVSAVLVVVLIGFLLLPIMAVVTVIWVVAIVALPIAQVIYGCYAALEAYSGRPFRYRWIADLIDRYQSQI